MDTLLRFFLAAYIVLFSVGVGMIIEHRIDKQELSLEQRRNIAIQFMCHDYRDKWSGARSFCGSVGPMDSKGVGE